jgi:hypothetical protein
VSRKSFKRGDLVTFTMGLRVLQGEVKEDRGPIGINGRRLYLVEFLFEPQAASLSQIELPADELQISSDAATAVQG